MSACDTSDNVTHEQTISLSTPGTWAITAAVARTIEAAGVSSPASHSSPVRGYNSSQSAAFCTGRPALPQDAPVREMVSRPSKRQAAGRGHTKGGPSETFPSTSVGRKRPDARPARSGHQRGAEMVGSVHSERGHVATGRRQARCPTPPLLTLDRVTRRSQQIPPAAGQVP